MTSPPGFIKVQDSIRGVVAVSKVFPGDIIAEEYTALTPGTEEEARRPIPEHHREQWEIIKAAFEANSVALMTCNSKHGVRTVICMVNRENNGDYTFVPVGELCEENPFEHYMPPT